MARASSTRARAADRVRHGHRRRGVARPVACQRAGQRHGHGRGKGQVTGRPGQRRALPAGTALARAASADESGAALSSGPRHRARATHRPRAEGAEGDGRLSNGGGGRGGLVLVAKPAGPTSHDVVDSVRRALGEDRVGHLGTLDPFAKGLLVLLVGRATRLAAFAAEWPKVYEGVIRLGVTTDTDDATGTVVATAPWTGVTPAQLAEVVGRFRGPYEQRPPAYSAVKIGGERAYRRARRGEAVVPAPRPVEIRELEIVEAAVPDLQFRATVSAGTYLRALARDIGAALGCGAHLTALRRTAVGPLRLADAVAPEAVTPAALQDAAVLVAHLPHRQVDKKERDAIVHGRPLQNDPVADSRYPIALFEGDELLAVAEQVGELLKPRVVVAEP